MRLSPVDVEGIATAARETCPPGSRIYLFGSRVDDQRRGGDIDLLVETGQRLPARQAVALRNRFTARLYRLIGERRIDVLIAPPRATRARRPRDRVGAGARRRTGAYVNGADRLSLALWEGDRHVAALEGALGEWAALGPTDWSRIEADPALQRLTDQILFRFMKLRDAMGERLVPGTLERLAEPYESWPMRDRLDRLEKFGYVDVDAWLRWREVRNRLAHEYPEQPDMRQASLLAAIQAARDLVGAYEAWRARLRAAGVEAG